MLEIDFHTILLWAVAVLIFSFDLIVYIGSSRTSSKLFCFFSLLVSFWSLSYGFLISYSTSIIPLILIKINHSLGIIASIGFIYFAISYPDDKKVSLPMITSTTIFGVTYSYIIIFTDLLIVDMFEIAKPDRWGWQPGMFYFTYGIIFASIWIYILTKIRNSHRLAKSSHDYINIKFMFWGLLLGVIPPLVLNIILPSFNIYGISWTGPIASAIWVFVIGYSIMRYRQMNVKVVITEMLAVAMTIIFFINIFIKTQLGTIENVVTFLIFLLAATYLIRSVLSEERVKEQLRVLNTTLESKVAEQTSEIRKSLENEKQAKRELEKLNETKNQFVIITQHSIRSPLQNLKHALVESIHSPSSQNIISQNISRLTTVVNDFLNIATIDTKSNILDLKQTDIVAIVEQVLLDQKHEVETKNIVVKVEANRSAIPKMMVDPHKIYEALLIVIDNAIKYIKRDGTVNISAKVSKSSCQIIVADNGIGLTKEDMQKIDRSLFYRGEGAKVQNPIGMGVGLSVAKAIVHAHHGKLNISSEGLNKGTVVTIDLPIDYLQQMIDNS